ncbi:fructose-1,6-bisphosphatase/inositol monophosphatase family enzyme [Rhizobium tibeticum]|nr:fructose-1,6-bisphosphatase/inositol monophosphatase family enzyme [Rhizobium tibeticum]
MTISIVEDAEIVAGVVCDAMLDEPYSAELGGGSYLNSERIRCVSSKGIEDVLVGAGLPIPGQLKAVPEDVYFSALKRLMATTAGVRRLGSAALSIACVACGRLDGSFEDGLSLHDYGASALVVRSRRCGFRFQWWTRHRQRRRPCRQSGSPPLARRRFSGLCVHQKPFQTDRVIRRDLVSFQLQ